MVSRVFPVYNKSSLSLCQLYTFAHVVVCRATLFQYPYRTGLAARQYSDVTQSRLHVILQGRDENPQLTEVVEHLNCCITSELNVRTKFYIFDHFILSWDPPNMIFDPSESSHDVSVHLPPPAQLSPLDQTWAMMHVRVRPGGRRFNLQV